jgi:hypothetical protein
VEWTIQRTLKIEEKPRQVIMSPDGKLIFVLTHKGEVLIYSPDGKLKDRLSVGKSVDGINLGPRANVLLLTSSKDSTVKIVNLDFIRNIDVSGSPFKGPADAPVVIANFSDFQ